MQHMAAPVLFALLLCAQEAPSPANLPPTDSPPLVRFVEIAIPSQNNASLVEPQTCLYYLHTRPSRPSEREWVGYDPQTAIDDFKRLWQTGFPDDIWVEVKDVPFDNGVVGKHVTFNLVERQRVKIVDYTGSKALETSKIEEKLKELHADIRLDSFIDSGLVRKVEGIVRDLLQQKGFQFASVTHQITEVPGGPKLVHLTFRMDQGPLVKIRRVEFSGNRTVGSRTLRRQLKTNKQRPWWRPSFLGGQSTYQETRFSEDADLILQYYRDHGFVTSSVGIPRAEAAGDARDAKTRQIDLHVPVIEGIRYRVGELTIVGDAAVQGDVLRPWFRLEADEYYSERRIRKGLEKARELYGAAGYYEFTGYPDLKPRDRSTSPLPEPPDALKAVDDNRRDGIVDVTMRLQEGHQFFVNRIEFDGNTTTHDNVIRREVALVEGGSSTPRRSSTRSHG
jgi:outer membrane protein insertion porin family